MWRREGKPLSEISFWLKRRKDARDLERYQLALRSLSSASLVCWHPRLASPASLRRRTSAAVVRQNVLCVIMRLAGETPKK